MFFNRREIDLETHGWTDENFAETGLERGLTLPEFLARMHKINSEGCQYDYLWTLRLYKSWQNRELLKIGSYQTWFYTSVYYGKGRFTLP